MTYVFLAAFLLSLIVLFLLYQRYQATLRLLTEAETRSKQSEDRLSEASLQLIEAQRGREEALLHGAGMKAQLSSLETQLKELREQKVGLSQELRESFQSVATEIIRERTKDLNERAEETLKPLRDDLQRFGKQVSETYQEESRERFSLKNEIKSLVERSQAISEETTNLTKALRGDSKVQGDWGEMILERILERSGLRKGEEYFVQETLRDEAGKLITTEDNRGGLRPDVIVRYPNSGAMVIDSKVSLTAYSRYLSADTEEVRAMALREHLQSIRKHIDELSRKKYEEHVSGAANFVMLFIPNEPAYTLALSHEPNLWEEAYAKNVVLINGTNLIAALRMAQDMWQRERQERNIQRIVEESTKLYDKFATFAETFLEVGKKLQSASSAFDQARGQLSEGRGNLVRRVEQLKELGIKTNKNLPAALASDETEE
ncbi:RmuC domain protein [Porphyromonas catoniae F0037]|jgi:rmuC domain protein|uniref:RmuC domain protein n=1 Tax=Porphyromonas catoniae F0037 TaxID=1127696 RepID=L1NIP2_9PORP|nr:DNA recombination protein RmuC [Porphyromonas catoniae]EKY03067.1 RmuC domain protein [Porphyromonas catoniae F0037]